MNSSLIDSVKLLIGEKDGAQNRSIPIAERNVAIYPLGIDINLVALDPDPFISKFAQACSDTTYRGLS